MSEKELPKFEELGGYDFGAEEQSSELTSDLQNEPSDLDNNKKKYKIDSTPELEGLDIEIAKETEIVTNEINKSAEKINSELAELNEINFASLTDETQQEITEMLTQREEILAQDVEKSFFSAVERIRSMLGDSKLKEAAQERTKALAYALGSMATSAWNKGIKNRILGYGSTAAIFSTAGSTGEISYIAGAAAGVALAAFAEIMIKAFISQSE